HKHTWKNDHQNKRIFSTQCQHFIACSNGTTNRLKISCHQCTTLLFDHGFRQATKCKQLEDVNYCHENYSCWNPILGKLYVCFLGLKEIIETSDAMNTPCVKYAVGVLSGKHKGLGIFNGLIEATMSRLSHEERGVEMQNFEYSPAFNEFFHILGIYSPQA
ncbi:hypothetical protein SERLA73DRAFT_66577, partial [Serpula lacrymans var. lacrymans S7.3]